MRKVIPHQFACVTTALEDLHAIAVEGQRGDNSSDMHHVLMFQLRNGVVALEGQLRSMSAMINSSAR
jgi:hypothetical protein